MPAPIRLLLLEDTPSDAELMLRELKRASIDVTSNRVETEAEFRQCLAQANIDVILADYRLPTFDGAAALRIATEITPEVPFIFVSGSIGEERAVLALRDGATDYILKDRMSRLGPAVLRALDEKKQREETRAAQDGLRESEIRFRSVVELAGDAILLTEGENKIVFANERAAWMFGRRAEEIVGQSKLALLAERVREEHVQLMESLRTGDDSSSSLTKKTIGLRRDGKEFPLEMSISSWRRDGQLFFTTILRDVSERVAAEHRQRTQFEVSRLLASSHSVKETMPELMRVMSKGLGWRGAALWLLDPASDRLSCAGAWMEGDSDEHGIVSACREATLLAGEGFPGRALNGTHNETVTVGYSDFDAPHRQIAAAAGVARVTAVPLNVTGSGIGVIEFFQGDGPNPTQATLDVTAEIATQIAQYVNLTRSEEARLTGADRLREAQQRSEMILECAAEGIIGVDRDARIIFTNPAALAILGRSPDELQNCPDTHDLFHHTKADGTPYPREECPVLLTLRDGQKRIVKGEVFWRPNGEPFDVEYEAAPIIEDGKLAGCVHTFRDVTESQALERQLELAKRIGSLGRVAATIAHEFNNVMMGIEPFAEMIRRSATREDKIRQAAEQISISLRRGRRVTEEILRFTQPSAPDLRSVDLREWLDNLGSELRAMAGATVAVVIALPDSPVYVACDATQLQQVVTNLLLNARDASPEGGKITISLAYPSIDRVELIVRDNGTGIPAAAVENIFEPLFTTKRTGTGLGLSVARQIVTQHGGSIDVSNVPTGGAEFRVLLAATSAAPAAAAVATPPAAQRSFHRLLLVEDDVLVAEGLTALLELEGLIVLVIGKGLSVVDGIETFKPDAVILDLTLPDVDGAEVFRRIRRRWPAMPVVFSTGHGGESELAKELKRDRVALLRKPYEIDDLLKALQRITAA